MNSPEVIERLAAEIGEKVYIDIAKWHLYLNDAHLHIPLAENLYPLLVEHKLSEQAVTDILGEMKVKVGGAKRELSLLDLIPMQCQMDLIDALEQFEQTL